MPDSIVFPSDEPDSETRRDERNGLANKVSENEMIYRHSSIKMPHDNLETNVQLENKLHHQSDILPLLSTTQEQLTYELLTQLLQNIFERSKDSKISVGFSTSEETTTMNPNERIDFQSLYSGPRIRKIPCPEGQHRTHNGLCQEASRKLQNSRG